MGLPVWENPRLVSRLFLKNAIKNSLTFLKAERQEIGRASCRERV